MKNLNAVKILNQYLTIRNLRTRIFDKVKSYGSLRLAKLLTELSSESEIEELINKMFNQEVEVKK